MPEIINGYLPPLGDVDAWAACLASLVANPQELAPLQPRANISFYPTYLENMQEALYRHL